ncbi:hypothetical protein [Agromyces larvae]|uniref:DUF4229 domain-containing protein n=1 Tax=Agromyces larvae TaxID=2929802 RepID=A0ABY4C2J0_9MICO|nr:hypothetical protein [Agromyces larvae]UOE45696.1 hypothetical protein MTO99_08115 [Agromyces larvae]
MPLLANLALVAASNQDEFDPDDVTPGIIGFIATFLIMAAVLLLVLDMVRRIRRVNYRAEANARLDAEAAEQAAQAELAGDVDGEDVDGGASEPPGEPPAR